MASGGQQIAGCGVDGQRAAISNGWQAATLQQLAAADSSYRCWYLYAHFIVIPAIIDKLALCVVTLS